MPTTRGSCSGSGVMLELMLNGNAPAALIFSEAEDVATLGALIAFHEHRTFANAVLMGINPFDQFGVELGKEIAKSIETEGTSGFDPSTTALDTARTWW